MSSSASSTTAGPGPGSVAVITGAGSGVGRAIAIALVGRGWRVVALGRTASSLAETASRCSAPERIRTQVADVRRLPEIERAVAETLASWGRIDALVNAAGTNVPNRSFKALSLADYHDLVDTNLHGSFHAVRAVLPTMRSAGHGIIVNVVSLAGRRASPLSGAGYAISKFGQAGLTQAINAEENQHGVRATAVFPGDIDTPLLDRRPNPPPVAARAIMLTAEDVAACILLAIELPDHAVVDEIVVRPRV
jgi:NADP-dependent 3-hydroxy acid dehydrogenase YdfG